MILRKIKSVVVKLRKIVGWYKLPPGYTMQRNSVGQWRYVDVYAPDHADRRYGDPHSFACFAIADAWFSYEIGRRNNAENNWRDTP